MRWNAFGIGCTTPFMAEREVARATLPFSYSRLWLRHHYRQEITTSVSSSQNNCQRWYLRERRRNRALTRWPCAKGTTGKRGVAIVTSAPAGTATSYVTCSSVPFSRVAVQSSWKATVALSANLVGSFPVHFQSAVDSFWRVGIPMQREFSCGGVRTINSGTF